MSVRSEKKPILFITGWVGTPNHFIVLENRLKIDGWNVFTLNLKHHDVNDLEKAAEEIQHTVEDIKIKTNATHVDLLCHSIAGLVARYYIKFLGGINSVKHYVSLGTPHYGTTINFLGDGKNLEHLQPNSGFLDQLNLPVETTGTIYYTAIWSSADEAIQPVENAKFKTESSYVQNCEVKGLSHLELLTHVDAYTFVKEGLLK